MTDPMNPISTEEDDDLLAAEYVLGVLALPDRAIAEARLRSDNAFQARVAAWELHLEGLNDEFTEAPAPNLMPAIEARLFPKPAPNRVRWFAGLFATAAATVALAVFLLFTPPAPSFTAILTADASPLRYEATVVGDTITLAQIGGDPTEPGRVRELWLIVGDAAPISLGLLTTQTTSLPAISPGVGAVLAISLEPAGGSPTGAPTGPVLVAGALQAT